MHPMQDPKVIQRRRHIDMILSMRLLINLQGLKIGRFRFHILALRREGLRLTRQRDGHMPIDWPILGLGFFHSRGKDMLRLRVVPLLQSSLSGRHRRLPGLLLAGDHQSQRKDQRGGAY